MTPHGFPDAGATVENQLEVLCDVSRRLARLEIPYMLTGSVAVNYYAEPRMTRDIDLVLELRDEDVERLVDAFSGEYYVAREAVEEAVRLPSVFNMIHLDGVVKVDCVVRKPSEYRRLEFARRVAVEIEGCSTYIVSREDLILSKLSWAKASHSEVQLRDVANLMRAGYDEAYVDRWKQVLGVGGLLDEVRVRVREELGGE